MTIFGHTIQRALKDYFCDHCVHLICEGGLYMRHLWKIDSRKVCVMRYHETPSCPDPEDFEEQDEKIPSIDFPLAA